MTQSLLLHTPRLAIVGINEINISQLTRYFLHNIEHLNQGGGKGPSTEHDVRVVYDNWFYNICHDTEVRFFLMHD
jgi:hypothetical protein